MEPKRIDQLAATVAVIIILALAGFVAYKIRVDEKLNTVRTLGAICLGVTFGWIVRFYFVRMNTFDPKGLSIIVAAVVGSTVVGFFRSLSTDEFAFYPIGLFIGYFGGAVWLLLRWSD